MWSNSEVYVNFNVKVVTYVERKRYQKVKRIKSPDVQLKEFSMTKQKIRSRTDYEWIGKTILKKSDEKNKKGENQCQNAACEQKTTSQKCKFGSNRKSVLEWTMNGLENHFEKNPIQ